MRVNTMPRSSSAATLSFPNSLMTFLRAGSPPVALGPRSRVGLLHSGPGDLPPLPVGVAVKTPEDPVNRHFADADESPIAADRPAGVQSPARGSDNRSPASRLLGVLRGARLDRNEIAGSLGDMGTFLPLLVGMSAQNGLDFGAPLFFAGLFNLVTGVVFSIPMAVQPMKAIAPVLDHDTFDRRVGAQLEQPARPG